MRKKHAKKIGWIAGVVVIALVVITVLVYPNWQMRKTVALQSEHYTVNNAMLSYFIHTECDKYVDQYENYAGSDYLSSVGLNPSVSLKKQKCCYEQDTWFDYFSDQALAHIRKVLSYCESARQQGKSDEQAISVRVEDRITILKALAAEKNREFDSYISHRYGRGVTEEDVRKALRLEAIADIYATFALQDSAFTDEELNAFVQSNPAGFLFVDYQSYSVIPAFEEDSDEMELEQAMAQAKETAEQLAGKMKKQGFDTVISEYLIDANTQAEAKDLSVVSCRYNTDTQLGAWLFDAKTRQGDTIVIKGNGMYTIYYRASDIYRQEYPSVKVQMIHVELDKFSSVDHLRKTLNSLTDSFKNYDGTESAFKSAAKSVGYGVLENNAVLKGEYGSFEMDHWIFDTDRKNGDYRCFEEEETVYYLRYVGTGEACWKVQARNRLTEQTKEQTDASLLAEYPVEKKKILYSLIPG